MTARRSGRLPRRLLGGRPAGGTGGDCHLASEHDAGGYRPACQAPDHEQQPALGAARPASAVPDRGRHFPAHCARCRDRACRSQPPTGFDSDDAPVVGAAFPGISGAMTADDIVPRNMTNAATELAAVSRQPADYNEAPVLGAAFPGVSGAVVADDLMPRNMTHAATELAAVSRQPADYNEVPVWAPRSQVSVAPWSPTTSRRRT